MVFEVWSVKLKDMETWADAQKEIERHAKVVAEHPLILNYWVLRPVHGALNRIMAVLMFESMDTRSEFFKSHFTDSVGESMKKVHASNLFVNDSWEMNQYFGPQIK